MSRAPIGGVSEISTTGVSEISTAGGERNGEGLLNLGFLGEVVTLWVRGFPDLVLTQKKKAVRRHCYFLRGCRCWLCRLGARYVEAGCAAVKPNKSNANMWWGGGVFPGSTC